MSENNAERLERLEEEWEVKSNDYNWLLQQARLVEEYAEVIDSQNKSLKEIQNKNDRLQEVIEDINLLALTKLQETEELGFQSIRNKIYEATKGKL